MSALVETEIGTIAPGWKVAPIGTVCEPPQYGYTASAEEKGNVRFLRITDITDSGVKWPTVPFCECPPEVFGKYCLASGDIVFARIGATTGKSYLITNPPLSVFASYLIRVRVKGEIDPVFLSQFFRSDAYWRQVDAQKNANLKKGVSGSLLKTLLVPIPPLPEQRKIAEVLGVVQRAMEQQERLLVLTAELKKALLHQLFTAGLRGEPQKQTDIGPVPESWEVVKLGSVANFQTGKLNSNAAKHDGKFPFFTCSQETFWIDYYAFDTEAILLSGNNAQGIYSVKHFKGKFNAYQRTYVITLKDNDSFPYFFLHQALSRNLDRLRMLSIGTSTKYLTMGVLQNLPIPKPGYDEAKRIGETLQMFEKKLQFVAKKRALLTLIQR